MNLTIPELQRKEATNWCSLFQQGRTRFAFISHQKSGSNITVWCSGDIADLQSAARGSTLNMLARPNRPDKGSWEDRFPCSFKISSHSQIADAAEILNNVSYPLSSDINKESSKTVIAIPLLGDEVSTSLKYVEGAVTQITVNSYERNLRARSRCIEFYGATCQVCSFKFEAIYGEVGREYIHVHHLKPLSEIKQGYIVDPITDIRPICPNCHSIIHRKTPPYTIEEVQTMIQSAKNKHLE